MLSPENYPAVVADSVRIFLSVDEIPGELDTVAALGADAAVVTATLHVTTKDIGGPVIHPPRQLDPGVRTT